MNRPDTDTSAALRHKYAGDLVLDGSPWRAAFESVPRHTLVPRFHQQRPDGTWERLTGGSDNYLETVYSDTALTTQLNEQHIPTSSSSLPSVMLVMLEALDVHDGQNVLEVGTGTGYNLALLATRLGDASVLSIEPDPVLVEEANRGLERIGHRPLVIIGDGTRGHPRRAPYDRIISTVGLPHIPPALVEQTATDGVLVVPLGYGLARLTRTGPGHAVGRFLPTPAHFMGLRGPSLGPAFDAARTSTGAHDRAAR